MTSLQAAGALLLVAGLVGPLVGGDLHLIQATLGALMLLLRSPQPTKMLRVIVSLWMGFFLFVGIQVLLSAKGEGLLVVLSGIGFSALVLALVWDRRSTRTSVLAIAAAILLALPIMAVQVSAV